MANRKHRVLLTLLTISFLVAAASPMRVFALSSESQTAINKMSESAFGWFLFVRNFLLIPFLILRYAGCGLRILGSVFLTKGEWTIDAVKKDFLYSTLALLVIIFLPSIMSWARGLFEANRWTPHTPSPPAPTVPASTATTSAATTPTVYSPLSTVEVFFLC